ncbi:MAG: hypothetical protein J7M17_02745 [Anaerolineae bacterium]|nr:hypothetical protein [Anaerolineae bacterium]
MVIKQALIDGAEFLHIQCGVVHPSGWAGRRFLVVDQVPEGFEQIAVGDAALVDFERFKQLAVEYGQVEQRRQGFIADLRE